MRTLGRCEAVRHCRWVDEVVPEAPWVIDAAFIEKVRFVFAVRLRIIFCTLLGYFPALRSINTTLTHCLSR